MRDRASGESALAAFRRFLLSQRGLLRSPRPGGARGARRADAHDHQSPALLAREQQIFARYTDSLAALLAEEAAPDAGDIEPWVAANAMTGIHRALVRHARRRVLEGARHPALAEEVGAHGNQAFALLELGLGSYARRGSKP